MSVSVSKIDVKAIDERGALHYFSTDRTGEFLLVYRKAGSISGQHYVYNATSADQLEWNGTDWFNSYEGVYKAGYWRIYL